MRNEFVEVVKANANRREHYLRRCFVTRPSDKEAGVKTLMRN